ncbi:MAG: uroporphyrinogen-III C-methyltransferase [Eubacterium sp.]|nr:uroporphyrinogen-III C-methyltransferase [Eubacterium sp.]
MKQSKGCVYLVGAGPGDAQLITLKGYKLLQQADCVIYDRLVSEELLQQVPKECECIYVGKENHHHTLKQDEINKLLVEKALQHKMVVRLKGGDPYVFGRGGEEALYLREHHVPFEVVPGVTSAVAAPAYAGIPITHRGISGGFHVVTAHNRRDELAEIDFDAMARGNDTCVFLMGLSKLGEIANRLMEAGMAPTQSVAVISHGTMPQQQCVAGQLENIEQKVKEEKITSPAIIVVGDVVRMQGKINQDLKSNFLLPKVGSEETKLSQYLKEQDIPVEEVQVGEIHYSGCKENLSDIREADWIVFTSRHGIEGFIRLCEQEEIYPDILREKKIAVIGKSTAEYLNKYGLNADLTPKGYTGLALAQELKHVVHPEETVLYIRAKVADSGMREVLRDCCQFREMVVYENCPVEITLPRKMEEYAGMVFTCASSVRRMMNYLQKEGRVNQDSIEEISFYSIGEKTTKALRDNGIQNVFQAEQATYLSLAEKIINGTE